MPAPRIRTLFTDIGGVMLTNGWDRKARAHAADQFGLNHEELHERHHLTFDTYEEGKLTLDEYLTRIVFYEPRAFARQDFVDFMFEQSQALPDMLEYLPKLKAKHGLTVIAVSNEGRELNAHRIRKFGLRDFIDAFVSSCYVHFRKPDADMYRIALDISQAAPEEVAYLEDRPMFVDIANELGIHGILHTDYASTRTQLDALGLGL
ncbi:MAG: HAD-IA family hydrolase [Pirellulales bacterium]|nr:HAD-IA family hydrolase [Pirellulales bacterium]